MKEEPVCDAHARNGFRRFNEQTFDGFGRGCDAALERDPVGRVCEDRPGLARGTHGDGFAIDDTCRDSPAPQVIGDRAADRSGSYDNHILIFRHDEPPPGV